MDDLSHIRAGMDAQKSAAKQYNTTRLYDEPRCEHCGVEVPRGNDMLGVKMDIHQLTCRTAVANKAVDRAFEANHSAAQHSWS